MKKKTSLLRGAFLLAAFCAVMAFGLRPETAGAETGEAELAKRIALGRIVMDGRELGVKNELPPVPYSHGAHQQVAECSSCHARPADEHGRWSWDFKSSSSAFASGADYRGFYHEGCVTCHEESASAGQKSGPSLAECRSCHLAEMTPAAVRETVDFSLGSDLHDQHMSSGAIDGNEDGQNCGSCHHTYDAEAKSLVPDYEPAEGCRSCHLETAQANPHKPGGLIPSYRAAAHASCVSCHLDLELPVTCDSCHAVAGQ